MKNFIILGKKFVISAQNLVIPAKAGIYLVIFPLLLISPLTYSLPDDNKQLMYLSANTADLNNHTHKGTFIDEVEFDQGSTHIRAALAITTTDEKNKLVKAIIKGNKTAQAHFWTLPANDKPIMHAYANTIYYYPEKNIIKLIGNAKVEQGENSFAAPTINYDTLHQHVISKGDKNHQSTIVFAAENQ